MRLLLLIDQPAREIHILFRLHSNLPNRGLVCRRLAVHPRLPDVYHMCRLRHTSANNMCVVRVVRVLHVTSTLMTYRLRRYVDRRTWCSRVLQKRLFDSVVVFLFCEKLFLFLFFVVSLFRQNCLRNSVMVCVYVCMYVSPCSLFFQRQNPSCSTLPWYVCVYVYLCMYVCSAATQICHNICVCMYVCMSALPLFKSNNMCMCMYVCKDV